MGGILSDLYGYIIVTSRTNDKVLVSLTPFSMSLNDYKSYRDKFGGGGEGNDNEDCVQWNPI